LRDDLSALFAKLLLLYKEKLRHFEIISSNEINLRYFFQSDNISGIINLLENDKDIFDKLDSIEFDIKSLTNEICQVSGIDKNNFNKFFLNRSDEPIPEIKILKDITDKKLSDMVKKREKLIFDMEKKLTNIAIDINTLKKIRELSQD
jgi:hypothetical protein